MTTFTTLGRNRLMDYSQLPAVLTATTGVLGAFGLGAKWLLNRTDRNAKADRDWQEAERLKLETLFTAQIENLKAQITGQNEEIHRLRTDLTAYVRHVGVLEGLLKANGIEAPMLFKPGI